MSSEIIRQRSTSGYCYYTKKNKKKTQDKLVLKKYDPKLRKHVLFTETRKVDSK